MITNSVPSAKVRLLLGGVLAVISFWDESRPVSKNLRFLRNPKLGALSWQIALLAKRSVARDL